MSSIFNSLERAKQDRTQAGKYKESLADTEWLGEIVLVDNDSKFDGRCKVRVFEKFDDIPDEYLPWAYPNSSDVFGRGSMGGAGSFSYPQVGSIVRIKFNNGDIYHPEYSSIQNLNLKMVEEIKQSYINCCVLLYDEECDVKLMYTEGI